MRSINFGISKKLYIVSIDEHFEIALDYEEAKEIFDIAKVIYPYRDIVLIECPYRVLDGRDSCGNGYLPSKLLELIFARMKLCREPPAIRVRRVCASSEGATSSSA